MTHRYKIGQTLELSSAPMHSNRPKGPCEVLSCLPRESGPPLYRVQCLNERNERVVEEADLSPSAQARAPSIASESFVSVAIGRR